MSDSELSLPPQSPSTPNNSTSAVKFTEKEERVLKAVWQCMKSVPEVYLTLRLLAITSLICIGRSRKVDRCRWIPDTKDLF